MPGRFCMDFGQWMQGIAYFCYMNGKTIPRGAWFCLLLVLVAGTGMFSQGGVNPFDLTPRIPKTAAVVPKPVDTGVVINPFDIIAPPKPGQAAVFVDSLAQQSYNQTVEAIREARHHRFLFAMVVGIFVILTIFFTLFRSIPGKAYHSFLNDNILRQLHREQGAIVSIPYLLFYLFFFLNTGFFLYLLCWHYQIPVVESRWVTFLLLTAGLAAIYAGKHLLLSALRAVLPIEKEVRLYSFTIIIFSIAIGVLLIPFNLLIAYGPESSVSGVISMALIMIGLVFAFRFVRGVFIGLRFVTLHLFHFLLYICTVEIAPALIVAKAIHLAITSN